MARTGRTFSESWHRVANLKVSLRPTVRVHRQFFRGERWYVLHDPFNNQFFRLRPEAHDFVIRLGPEQTVEQVWEDCLNRHPDEAPGQEDVIQLLTQLYYANLLYFEMPPDSAKLFERYKKRRQREIQSRLLSIMFARFPLLDPEIFLKRIMPLIKLLVSPFGAIVWLAVVIAAGKVVVDHFDTAFDQFQGVLAPENLFLLYLGLVVIKTLHEFGHALVCKRYGGEVHTMGVMLLVFTPLPYMDATSSWSFKSRWHRALVGAAGMITELFVAAVAVAQREEAMAMVRKARQMEKADLEPLFKRLETVETKLKDLLAQKESLTVKARESGRWVAPKITELAGSWLPRGTTIGEIVNHGDFRFSAVVSQEEASELFAGHIERAEVRLYGQSGNNLDVKDYQIIPFQHEKLPSAALGWLGGGEVPISTKDQTGRQAAEPFFQIYANVIPGADVVLLHGRSGKLRFTLDSKPLVFQWGRMFLQLLQRRYQI